MPDRSVIAISTHPNIGKIDEHEYFRLYRELLADPDRFWGEHGKRLDWIKPYSKVMNASFEGDVSIRWYEDGTLNASYNCIDRHLATRGDQTAILWEGDDPGEDRARHLSRAARERLPPRQRAEGAGRQEGRPGHDLPADDPRGGGRDARLRPHRRDPFGRVRRLLAGQPRRPHRGLPLDRPDHRRRRAARRPQGAAEAQRRRGAAAMSRRSTTVIVVRRTGGDSIGSTAATSGITRSAPPPRPTARPRRCRPKTRCSSSTPRARPASRRACCTRPAAISSTRR